MHPLLIVAKVRIYFLTKVVYYKYDGQHVEIIRTIFFCLPFVSIGIAETLESEHKVAKNKQASIKRCQGLTYPSIRI